MDIKVSSDIASEGGELIDDQEGKGEGEAEAQEVLGPLPTVSGPDTGRQPVIGAPGQEEPGSAAAAVVAAIQLYRDDGESLEEVARRQQLDEHVMVRAMAKSLEERPMDGGLVGAARNLDLFNRIGLRETEVFIRISEGMRFPTRIRFEGKGEDMIATPEPDHKLRLEYIKEYNKMTGRYPSEDEIEKHLHVHVDPDDVRGKGAIGASNAYENVLKNMGGRGQ